MQIYALQVRGRSEWNQNRADGLKKTHQNGQKIVFWGLVDKKSQLGTSPSVQISIPQQEFEDNGRGVIQSRTLDSYVKAKAMVVKQGAKCEDGSILCFRSNISSV